MNRTIILQKYNPTDHHHSDCIWSQNAAHSKLLFDWLKLDKVNLPRVSKWRVLYLYPNLFVARRGKIIEIIE